MKHPASKPVTFEPSNPPSKSPEKVSVCCVFAVNNLEDIYHFLMDMHAISILCFNRNQQYHPVFASQQALLLYL